jgi:hypothetical protein
MDFFKAFAKHLIINIWNSTAWCDSPKGFIFKNFTFCHAVCVRFVYISEQRVTFVLYSINWLVFIIEMKSAYCAVRTGSLNKAVCASALKG